MMCTCPVHQQYEGIYAVPVGLAPCNKDTGLLAMLICDSS